MTDQAKKVLWIFVAVLFGVSLYFLLKPESSDPIIPNNPSGEDEVIRVLWPKPYSEVMSPINVSGEARGSWFFEANSTVEIVDANGQQLGFALANAQGDWMTSDFVPFSGILSFSTSTTPTGKVIFHKDNPSGLPQHDASYEVPIRFREVLDESAYREIKLFFYDERKDRDSSGNVMCTANGLVEIKRNIPITNTPIQTAVKELLKGPTQAELSRTPGTEFPLAGLSLESASLSGGVLTLNFKDPQGKTVGGSCRVGILTAQISATAKQFGGVTEVRFSPEGVFQP